MDFFTVPTLTFGVLYCFFLIAHDRRKILHCNATRNPQALWIVQQLREAWPYTPVHRFLLFDRDAKFGDDVVTSHLKRLMSEYVRYYQEDPTHRGLAKDTPLGRPTAIGSAAESKIRSFPRLGGLHHRYGVAA